MTRRGRRALAVSGLLALAGFAGSCMQTPAKPLAQGWSAQEQAWWYEATQGSRLMPYAWFTALEQPDSDQPFLADAHMAGFRFLPRTTSFGAQLPVGFALDDNDDSAFKVTRLRWFRGQKSKEKWVGLNCAACHTAEIAYQGTPVRIDGGPSLVDFQAFVESLDRALVQTRDVPDKWDRFAHKVLGARDDADNRALLRQALDSLVAWQARSAALNQTALRSGYARVDAFGHIYNKVALFTGADAPTANPADAPVSYPFLWGISRHDKLQYNGIAQNARLKLGWGRYLDYGAMGRNAGEVIGVFGEVVVTPGASLAGYKSSVWANNLDRLETQLATLRPPAWPASFPAPDAAKVAAGERLYAQHCASCHQVLPKDNATTPIAVKMVPFRTQEPENRTDPWMACNAFTYRTNSGALTGTKADYLAGTPIPSAAPVATLLTTMVKGALVGKKGQIIATAASTFAGFKHPPRVVTTEGAAVSQTREQRRAFCLGNDDPLLAYKARPLEGVWATAPYLHNGSVPSLYDLLLPAEQRPRCFALGTREYDPVHVGYRFDRAMTCAWNAAPAPGSFTFFATDADGKPIDGNSNIGHDYGAAAMTDADRWALVEYMKTL